MVAELQRISQWDVIDLSEYNITQFDYEHRNRNDDYLNLLRTITEKYELLIFATPVYWYAMSGIMKIFFDRLTDLLRIEKDTGRKLRGKYMAVISSSNGGNLGDQFWLPFQKSAEYLGMHYVGDLHTLQGQLDRHELSRFKGEIEQAIIESGIN